MHAYPRLANYFKFFIKIKKYIYFSYFYALSLFLSDNIDLPLIYVMHKIINHLALLK